MHAIQYTRLLGGCQGAGVVEKPHLLCSCVARCGQSVMPVYRTGWRLSSGTVVFLPQCLVCGQILAIILASRCTARHTANTMAGTLACRIITAQRAPLMYLLWATAFPLIGFMRYRV